MSPRPLPHTRVNTVCTGKEPGLCRTGVVLQGGGAADHKPLTGDTRASEGRPRTRRNEVPSRTALPSKTGETRGVGDVVPR